MVQGEASLEAQERVLRNWMLSLLRFAVTRDAADQVMVIALAIELDRGNAQGSITYFQRTSAAICNAILCCDREGLRILKEHIRHIDHPELKRAFAAALGIDVAPPSAKGGNAGNRFRRKLRLYTGR
jgi:hypothetical protein